MVTPKILLLLLIFSPIISGEIYIKKEKILSYLFVKFDNVTENIFPYKINVNVSLTRVSGTLLYSIDKNMNQLIVSLHNPISPMLKIEFRKNQNFISLAELCGCSICRYEVLELIIEIEDLRGLISIQCNARDITFLTYGREIGINENYPIPYLKNESSLNDGNKAQMWFVNNHVCPNGDQMSGCIFDIMYKNRPIQFSNISENIAHKCKPICLENICNKGKCYETYEDSPLCDCDKSFQNGPYCNATMKSNNIQSRSKPITFDMFKVSWKSFERELLIMRNGEVQFALRSDRTSVFFEIKIGNRLIIIGILTSSYVPNTESILIGYFKETGIEMEFKLNGSWNKSSILNIHNLTDFYFKNIVFDYIHVRSCNGTIDLAYRTDGTNMMWIQVQMDDATTIHNCSLPRFNETNSKLYVPDFDNIKNEDKNPTWLKVILFLSILLNIALGTFIFWWTKKMRNSNKSTWIKKMRSSNKTESDNGIEMDPLSTRTKKLRKSNKNDSDNDIEMDPLRTTEIKLSQLP